MADYRFCFDLKGVGPLSPADLEAAMSSAQEYGLQETRVGVYGKVTGVRDGRPIGHYRGSRSIDGRIIRRPTVTNGTLTDRRTGSSGRAPPVRKEPR